MKSKSKDTTQFEQSADDRQIHLKKTDAFKKIEIECPLCKQKESYLISPKFLSEQHDLEHGPIKVTLFSGTQSKHKISFNIDKDFIVRNLEILLNTKDFQVEDLK